MDRDRFDALTRLLVSRRSGFGLGVAAVFRLGQTRGAAAKAKPCSACKRRKNGACEPRPNGAACGPNRVCRGGRCATVVCPPGRTACGRACVDLESDARNCGGCGQDCTVDEGAFCRLGQCAIKS